MVLSWYELGLVAYPLASAVTSDSGDKAQKRMEVDGSTGHVARA